MEQRQEHEVDLTQIEGKGEFSCPKCKSSISPNDETEEVYSILGTKVGGQILEELVIQCNRCMSRIRLTGFSLLGGSLLS